MLWLGQTVQTGPLRSALHSGARDDNGGRGRDLMVNGSYSGQHSCMKCVKGTKFRVTGDEKMSNSAQIEFLKNSYMLPFLNIFSRL